MDGKTLVFLSKMELSQLVEPDQQQFLFTKLKCDGSYQSLVVQIRSVCIRSLKNRLVRSAYSAKRDKNQNRKRKLPVSQKQQQLVKFMFNQPHPVALSLIASNLEISLSHAARWLNSAAEKKIVLKLPGKIREIGKNKRILECISNTYLSKNNSVLLQSPSCLAFL